MKKFLVLALASVSTYAAAQFEWSATRFGIVAGPDYSQVKNAHNPSGPMYNFFAGGIALIPFNARQSNQFYIQPGIQYLGAGEKGGKDAPNAVYGNSYISIPLHFKAYFSEAENEFFALVGPKFNFLINQNIKSPARLDYTSEKLGKANPFNLAVSLGGGYSYKRKAELFVTYDIGLSDTYPDLKETWTGDSNTEKKKSEQIISVGIVYLLD